MTMARVVIFATGALQDLTTDLQPEFTSPLIVGRSPSVMCAQKPTQIATHYDTTLELMVSVDKFDVNFAARLLASPAVWLLTSVRITKTFATLLVLLVTRRLRLVCI